MTQGCFFHPKSASGRGGVSSPQTPRQNDTFPSQKVPPAGFRCYRDTRAFLSLTVGCFPYAGVFHTGLDVFLKAGKVRLQIAAGRYFEGFAQCASPWAERACGRSW